MAFTYTNQTRPEKYGEELGEKYITSRKYPQKSTPLSMPLNPQILRPC